MTSLNKVAPMKPLRTSTPRPTPTPTPRTAARRTRSDDVIQSLGFIDDDSPTPKHTGKKETFEDQIVRLESETEKFNHSFSKRQASVRDQKKKDVKKAFMTTKV